MKTLLEIKARYRDLDKAKIILDKISAERIGVFHQIDTYFNIDRGRLKLREIEGQDSAQLVYYIRENIEGPKHSKVFLAKICDTNNVKQILSNIFGVKVVVDKIREIYRYNNVQIHLDEVKGLGKFIEFELEIENEEQDRLKISRLMKLFDIDRSDLIKFSYSDLLLENKSNTF